ncbi:MAG: hypothetical protein K2Y16_14230 [Burkholderiales bacterium]|nr:hypothetical protein [Burkholderiales bacterium]MBY0576488.1 hypothetical protein [Gallionellaceae bacterium]
MTIALRALKTRFPFWAVFHILVSTILIAMQFAGLDRSTVLLIHDQYFPLTGSQALANLDILSNLNGGMPNGILFAINGFDSVAFAGLYGLGLDPRQAEIVYLSLLLSIALILMHFGFFRLLRNKSRAVSVIPTYAFALSPFLLVYYNIGVFWSAVNMLGIAVLPLTVAAFRDLLSSDRDALRVRKDIALLGMCLAIYGFAPYYAVPVAATLLGFLVFDRSPGIGYKTLARRFIPALAIAALLALVPIFATYIERYSFGYSFAEGPLANSMADAVQGGVLTPMLQYASWAIYVLWSPRILLGFPSHFTSIPYVIFALAQLIMGVVVLLIFRGAGLVRACWFGLLVSLFFAKAGTEPFGGIFNEALQNISIFGLIRSPDTKFGLPIAFLLVVMLGWGFSELLKSKKRAAAFFTLAALAALPCLNAGVLIKGSVIRGANGELSHNGSYAFPLDASFMEAARYIGSLSSNSAIYFATWHGAFNTPKGFTVLLRDPLADFIKQPVYFSGAKSITAKYISDLTDDFEATGDVSYLRQLGVRYIVVNLLNQSAGRDFSGLLAIRSVSEVFNNGLYRIFLINGGDNISPIEVRAGNGLVNSKIRYRKYLDTIYEIDPDMIRSSSFDLVLKTANSRSWHAFSVDNLRELLKISLREFILGAAGREKDRHNDFRLEKRADSGFNHWSVRRQCVDASGGVKPESGCRAKIFLVFIPQVFLSLLMLISGIGLLIVGYAFCRRRSLTAKTCKSNI